MPVEPSATGSLVADYAAHGWSGLPARLGPDRVAELRAAIERISAQDRPEVVHEAGSSVVRAVHGCHRHDDGCARLVRHPALVDAAEALLGTPAYVYQFKVNLKQPRLGAAWPWHRDYPFWRTEDGMPEPRALTIALLLDDVDSTNGPLTVIPGTHLLDVPERVGAGEADWRSHVSADLPHRVDGAVARHLAEAHGTVELTGPAGTLFAFHPNLVHSSAENRSDRGRALLLITYNSVTNAPRSPTRPDFLVDRDTTPVTRLASTR